MSRPSRDQWALEMAIATAKRSTCLRRSVGCVLLDFKGRVLSTGVNGVASGMPHCNEEIWTQDTKVGGAIVEGVPTHPHACPGARAPSGTQLEACEAIHAEQNALLQCRDVDQIHTACVTHSPCVHCVKMLMNTNCIRIVFAERYSHDAPARALWERQAGRTWELLAPESSHDQGA